MEVPAGHPGNQELRKNAYRRWGGHGGVIMNRARNLGTAERMACAVAGTGFAIAGIRFLRRAFKGHCSLQKAKTTPAKETVDLASEESFPASDPPAWNAR